ncbi:MAG: ankyrin repeat domain-containing protein [Acidobacteria bacterium]|nr:ankyrin repeat domain-containing protein [Acidobacteriota bacterium]
MNFVLPTYTLAETIRHDYTVFTTTFLRFRTPIDEPDIHGWTGLMYATLEGNTELASNLLSQGANVNHRGNGGQTPLMCAAAMGYSDLVELLINHGARINFRDCDGKSALIFALEDDSCEFGHLSLWKAHHDTDQNYVRRRKNQTTQVLLKHLPVVNPSLVGEKDYHHKTLLMYAVEGQNPNFVFWLLANGANVNAQDDSGQTPLMFALSNKHEFAYIYFEKLVDRGADIQLKDSNGASALVYAIQNQQFEATQQLILWGTDLNLQLASDFDLIGLIHARFPREQAVELASLISKKQHQAQTIQHSKYKSP